MARTSRRLGGLRRLDRLRRPQLVLLVLVAALLGYVANAVRDDHSSTRHSSRASTTSSASAAGSAVALSALPAQASDTVALIERGGPFPYAQDGAVFANAERRLPLHPRGYYREYTVPTPGSADRGARRIVTGRDGEYWYTGDHYETFERVDTRR